mmetsp:Transcript_2672/g.6433  ORF Transcript_2672/g.6433 Transcript_2672/m.6433 type:complete len:407 (+) Transcript_2672:1671-2891(+)
MTAVAAAAAGNDAQTKATASVTASLMPPQPTQDNETSPTTMKVTATTIVETTNAVASPPTEVATPTEIEVSGSMDQAMTQDEVVTTDAVVAAPADDAHQPTTIEVAAAAAAAAASNVNQTATAPDSATSCGASDVAHTLAASSCETVPEASEVASNSTHLPIQGPSTHTSAASASLPPASTSVRGTSSLLQASNFSTPVLSAAAQSRLAARGVRPTTTTSGKVIVAANTITTVQRLTPATPPAPVQAVRVTANVCSYRGHSTWMIGSPSPLPSRTYPVLSPARVLTATPTYVAPVRILTAGLASPSMAGQKKEVLRSTRTAHSELAGVSQDASMGLRPSTSGNDFDGCFVGQGCWAEAKASNNHVCLEGEESADVAMEALNGLPLVKGVESTHCAFFTASASSSSF